MAGAQAARVIALAATLVDLALGVVLWANYDIGGAQWQFQEMHRGIFGPFNYALGIDGSDGQAGLLTERGQGLVERTGRDLPANGGGSILCVGGGRQQARRGQGQAQRDGKRARGRAG